MPTDRSTRGDDGDRQSGETIEDSTASPEQASSSELLHQILLETMASSTGEGASELGAVMTVARRYPNQPLSQDPIVAELVMALLQQRYAKLPMTSDEWQDVSRRIAESLMEDPVSRDRLTKFWDGVSKAST